VGDISDQLGDYKLLQQGPVRCILFMQYKTVRTAAERYELTLHVSWECDFPFETPGSSLVGTVMTARNVVASVFGVLHGKHLLVV
jgi:hypothetical protein